MNQISTLERIIRGVLITLVVVFFLFPIFWILLMSFQTNEQILRIPPSLFFEPTLQNYIALLTGRLETTAGNLDIAFMRNLGNSLLLSTCSVLLPSQRSTNSRPARSATRSQSAAWRAYSNIATATPLSSAQAKNITSLAPCAQK